MSAQARLLVAVLAGLLGSVGCLGLGWGDFVVLIGWIIASGTFTAWTWAILVPMDGPATRSHSTREDPSRRWAHAVLLVAVLASLIGVGFLVASAGGTGLGPALVGLVAIAMSWVLVHTLYTVRYAHVFYNAGGKGVNFEGSEEPTYRDFAYLAFTLGMTFQVSDTNLTTAQMRATALGHALLSYLLGVVVIAITINLVVQLAGGFSAGPN